MLQQFRIFKRRGIFYREDRLTGEQKSLKTKIKAEALVLLNGSNEAHRQPNLNLHLARVYLLASDPEAAKRLWQDVMNRLASHGKEQTRSRCAVAMKSKDFDAIANLKNERTKRAYGHDVANFMRFVGIKEPSEFRLVKRAHVIAWRKTFEAKKLAPATVRRKLSALSDLFDYLNEKNSVSDNPVHGFEHPKEGANQGKTPAISDAQAAALLEAPTHNLSRGATRDAYS